MDKTILRNWIMISPLFTKTYYVLFPRLVASFLGCQTDLNKIMLSWCIEYTEYFLICHFISYKEVKYLYTWHVLFQRNNSNRWNITVFLLRFSIKTAMLFQYPQLNCCIIFQHTTSDRGSCTYSGPMNKQTIELQEYNRQAGKSSLVLQTHAEAFQQLLI